MDTRHADGVDWERRSALVLGLASMSAAVVGQGREAMAQQTNAADRQDVGQAVEAFITKYLDAYNKKDAAGVAALYTEGGLLVPPGHQADIAAGASVALALCVAAGLGSLATPGRAAARSGG